METPRPPSQSHPEAPTKSPGAGVYLDVKTSVYTAVLAALLATPLLAQTDSAETVRGRATGTVAGRVVDERGIAIANARVIHSASGTSAATASDGDFRIAVPLGQQEFRVIALGFVPVGAAAAVRGDREARLDVRMRKAVVTLDSVRVASTRVRPSLRDYEARRQQPITFGRFITSADIERWTPVYTSDLIRNLPGFSVVGDGPQARILDTRSGANPSLDPDPPALPSRAGRRRPPSQRERDIGYRSCVRVFLDGMSLADGAVNALPPAMLHGIEIYRGPSAPVEYMKRGTCAVILLWSK